MKKLSEIETLTKAHADARERLGEVLVDLERDLARARAKHLEAIKERVADARNTRAVLVAAIEDSPGLFVRPKTLTVHGIKVGFRKGKGRTVIANAATTIRLIKKHFKERARTVIEIKESLIKTPLGKWSSEDLRKVGIEVTDATDEVVIAPTDSDIEKLVEAMLKDAEAAA